MKTYYIYEIPGIKNGATKNWDKRSLQNFEHYGVQPIIVETYELPDTEESWQFIGDREWELADMNGYPRGTHYKDALLKRRLGTPTFTFEQRSKMSSDSAKTLKRIEQWKNATSKSRVKVTCPHCNTTGSKNVYLSKHFDNCRFNSNNTEMVEFNLEVFNYSKSHSVLNTANTFNINRGIVKKIINYYANSDWNVSTHRPTTSN